jgi:surface protein
MTNCRFFFTHDGWPVQSVEEMDCETMVRNVTNMGYMFYKAYQFNRDIGHWDISSVTKMRGMFYEAAQFIGDLGRWEMAPGIQMVDLFSPSDFNR